MVSLAGLSAVYPGYQQADSNDAQTRLNKAKATGAETELAGDAAFGNTLKMMQAQIPGAQPMPGAQGAQPGPQMAQGPQAPAPGQPSVPMRPPQQMQPPMPQGQTQPQGGAPMQPQGQPQDQPGGGQQGGQGQLDWRVIMGKVAQANPNAPPQVLAAAVNKFLPLMNQQAQMEWKQVQLALMGQRANTGQQRADTADEEAQRRREQGDKRIGQGDERLDESLKKREADSGKFDRRENDRALDRMARQKKDALTAQLQRERNEIFAAGAGVSAADLKTRLDAAQKRHDEAVAKIDKEMGPAPVQGGPVVRKYNPETGKIE